MRISPPSKVPSSIVLPPRAPALVDLIVGDPGGHPRIGLVMKRTYRLLGSGQAEPLPLDEQEPLLGGHLEYHELDVPFVAPVSHDNDQLAFRPFTDLVVQGSAHTYGQKQQRTSVAVQTGALDRVVTVYGHRELMLRETGMTFTEPEPFESMPVRYDHAFGGVDLPGWLNGRPDWADDLLDADDTLPVDLATDFHYARNPSGDGFIVEFTDETLEYTSVPNLEFPFDPVTPERMVVGSIEDWWRAPLPAAFDWCSRMWFPWTAYLGVGRVPVDADALLWETRMNWVAPGISRLPDLIETEALLPPVFFQGASPGMWLSDLPVGSTVQLRNLHPEFPVFPVTVPDDPPRALLELGAGSWTELQPRLNALVIRPDEGELVMVWRADVERTREYAPADLAGMARWVGWPHTEGGA